MGDKPLSPKHKRFVAEYLKDLNATQAYIRAGYDAKNADANATRLMGNDGIAAAIEKAQGKLADTAEIDAAQIIRDLQALSAKAAGEGQYSAAIKAKELVGKHAGMFVERRETKITDNRLAARLPEKSTSDEAWASEVAAVH